MLDKLLNRVTVKSSLTKDPKEGSLETSETVSAEEKPKKEDLSKIYRYVQSPSGSFLVLPKDVHFVSSKAEKLK